MGIKRFNQIMGDDAIMILIDYYNLPSDRGNWSEEDKKVYNDSCKDYHELKIHLSHELPYLYNDVISKLDLVKVLDDDINLAVILAMSNKLSFEYQRLHITLLMQYSEKLKPIVVGYYYNGIISE